MLVGIPRPMMNVSHVVQPCIADVDSAVAFVKLFKDAGMCDEPRCYDWSVIWPSRLTNPWI
jgi:hypothetical protein